MAAQSTAPKRRRLEKIEPEPQPKSNKTFICYRCGTAFGRLSGRFPVSHSPMYRGVGYLPLCNECIDQLFEQYRNELGSDRAAMRRMCMKLDLYWNDAIYDMVEKTAGVNSRVRNYIGKTNIIHYIDKNFDDTIREEERDSRHGIKSNANAVQASQPSSAGIAVNMRDPEPVTQEMIDFWGAGYPKDMYAELERHYQDWTGGESVSDPSARSLYRQICLLEVTIARDGAQGKPIDKNVNALNTLLGSMNLKPSQKKEDTDAELEKMPLGVGIQKWEESRPLPETPKNKRDVRGTVRNITTWYLGHLCKMVGIKNSYCRMYEDAMEELRVKHPEYDDEDDDALLTDIFEDGSAREKNGDIDE